MSAPSPALRVVSFGTVHGGLPANIQPDHVHDVSDWFRDPNVSPELRELTGLDQAVIDSVMAQEGAWDFVEGLYRLVLPQLMKCRRTLVTAIGCVGGRHRSVVFAEELRKLAARDWSVEVVHLHKDMPVTRRSEVE